MTKMHWPQPSTRSSFLVRPCPISGPRFEDRLLYPPRHFRIRQITISRLREVFGRRGHFIAELSTNGSAKFRGPEILILDLDSLQRYFGIERSLDDRKWYLYRQPYTEAFWNELGRQLAESLTRQRIAAKKCIVIDCDNTLWGGIIGEDGLAGIALGEDYPGSVFRDFQHQLLTLRSQGVMVAICSKNEADVWEVFDSHDGMLLSRDHIVAHRINWQDKVSNICSIAGAELWPGQPRT